MEYSGRGIGDCGGLFALYAYVVVDDNGVIYGVFSHEMKAKETVESYARVNKSNIRVEKHPFQRY